MNEFKVNTNITINVSTYVVAENDDDAVIKAELNFNINQFKFERLLHCDDPNIVESFNNNIKIKKNNSNLDNIEIGNLGNSIEIITKAETSMYDDNDNQYSYITLNKEDLQIYIKNLQYQLKELK